LCRSDSEKPERGILGVRPLGKSKVKARLQEFNMRENAGKLKCAGAETGNSGQKKIGGHSTSRSAESQVKPKSGSAKKSSKDGKRRSQYTESKKLKHN